MFSFLCTNFRRDKRGVPDPRMPVTQWRTQEFFSGGVQQIQLRTEVREDGDLGAVAP